LTMVLHGGVIALISYFVMLYGFTQTHDVARARSVLLGALLSAYMILFGHGSPTFAGLNPELGF